MKRLFLLLPWLLIQGFAPLGDLPDDLSDQIRPFYARRQVVEALSLLKERAKTDPRNFGMQLELGRLEAYRGEDAKALEHFKAALALRPESIEAQVLEAQSWNDQGAYNQTIALLEKRIPEWERQHEHPRWLARALTVLAHAQALKASKEGLVAMMAYGPQVQSNLEKALPLDLNGARTRYMLGLYYLQVPAFAGGGKQRGMEFMRRAAQLDPDDHVVREGYIRQVLEQEGKEAAKKLFEAFVRDFQSMSRVMERVSDLKARLQ